MAHSQKMTICNKTKTIKIILLASTLLINFFYSNFLLAQESVRVSYIFGNIHPHNVLIKPLIHDPATGFSLTYTWKNDRGKEWRSLINYPNHGFSYNYIQYGNQEELGSSHSFLYYFQFSFLPRRNYFDLGLQTYTGVGYFNKTYDTETNPNNQAISSKINIGGSVRLYTRVRVKPFYIEYSRGLNHFSNGITKTPNLGLNVKSNYITLGYEFEDQPSKQKIPKNQRIINFRQEIWIYGATGIKEVDGMKGKKYIPVNASLNYTYRTSFINKMGMGLDFVYDPSLEDFATINYEYTGNPPLNFRWGLSFHNEFILGNAGLFMSYGFYPKNSEYYTRQRYYKVGLKYYFNNFIGVALLRAMPLFRADLIELGIGYRIKFKKH